MGSDVAFLGHGGTRKTGYVRARDECAADGIFSDDPRYDACVQSYVGAFGTELRDVNQYYCSSLRTFIERVRNDDIHGIIESGRTLQHAIIQRDLYGKPPDTALYELSVRIVEIARGKEPARGGMWGSGGATHPTRYETQDPRMFKESIVPVLEAYLGEC